METGPGKGGEASPQRLGGSGFSYPGGLVLPDVVKSPHYIHETLAVPPLGGPVNSESWALGRPPGSKCLHPFE